MRAAVVLLVALAVAGCLGAEPSTRTPPAHPSPLAPVLGEPIVQDHDHTDPALHNASWNLRLVSHVKPWGDGSEYGNGTVNEFAVNGNLVFVSRSNPEGGFAVVDLTDVRHPAVIGDFRSEGGGDVEVTSDGAFALLSTQRTLPGQQTTDNPTARAPRGVYVVDVQDPTHPTLASFLPLPVNGPHTMHYHRVSPTLELVTLATYDLVTNPLTGTIDAALPPTQRVYIDKLVRDGTGARLEPLGLYSVIAPPDPSKLVFPHDVFIETHPETGALLMYVAYWDAGLKIVDITDPTMPREVATVTDFAPSALVALHDARTFPAPIQGKHVTVVGPEIVTAPEAGQLTFLDTTDPASPEKLGWWSIPGNLTVDTPFIFSPHVFDTDASGRVVVGHYHGGVWLIDAHDPANATSIGFYQPHEERAGEWGARPSVWGARFFRGYILATDGPTGLYVLETDAGPLPGLPVGRAG
ncbi:MAG TPA: hypothetical protein VM370_13720 [Candidatus Thermoplasmatota archaeon]|nr:hypothetical protein [Candidatus Thermoplasmatota archaeon]